MDSRKLSRGDLPNFSDVEVLDMYDQARANMSFFNAAEREMWQQERNERLVAQQWLSDVKSEVEERGLTPNPGSYLI